MAAPSCFLSAWLVSMHLEASSGVLRFKGREQYCLQLLDREKHLTGVRPYAGVIGFPQAREIAHGTSVVTWTPRREKDLSGPLKTQPHKFKQPTYTIWILAQPKPSLLEVSPPESCARAKSVLKSHTY